METNLVTCFGGGVQQFRVSPYARPAWREGKPGTLKYKPDGIPARCWGNSATARPERRPLQS